MRRRNTLSLLILTLPTLALAGQETPLDLTPVVVTATRFAEPGQNVPAAVSVITREEITTSTARTIPELLRGQPGLLVNDINGTGRNYTVDLRGFGETGGLNTLVLVDGRRVNQPDLSGSDWSLIPLERIERIEIVRGGRAAVLYGDNATGGVVNIITRKSMERRAEVKARGGSDQTGQLSLSLGDQGERHDLTLTAGITTTDGFRENAQADSRDFGFSFSHDPNDRVTLDLSGGYHKDKTGLPGPLRESDYASGMTWEQSKYPNDFADTEDGYLQLAPELRFGEGNLLKLELSARQRTFVSYANFTGGDFTGESRLDTLAFSPRLLVPGTLLDRKNRFTLGADLQSSREVIHNASNFFGFISTGDYTLEKRNAGWYLHDEWSWNDALSFSVGGRLDRAEFSFDPSDVVSMMAEEEAANIGVNYRWDPETRLFASWSRSFRYPVLDEFYSFFSNTVSTTLVPQNSDTWEAGVERAFSPTLQASATLFRIDTRSEIFYNADTFANENWGGDTRRTGVELALEKRFATVDAGVSYTWMDPQLRGGADGDKQIPNVPHHQAALSLAWHASEATTALVRGRYVGVRPFVSDFANTLGDQDAYGVVDARVSHDWGRFTLFLDVDNVTNHHYAEYGVMGTFPTERAYYPSSDRRVFVGVTARFE